MTAHYELPRIPSASYLEKLKKFTTQQFDRVELVRLKPQGTAENPEWNTILDEKGYVDEDRIESRASISGESLTEVFKIFFDLQDDEQSSFCYNPRNGILFYDQEGNYLGFVELCFECYNSKYSSTLPLCQSPDLNGFSRLRKIFAQYQISTAKE